MTSSATPYAVFKVVECVFAVDQSIGICQCLRITPEKLVQIWPSIKKKSGNSLRKRFLKKHVRFRLDDMSTF